MLVGARQAGLSILEEAELLGHIKQSLLFWQHGAKKLPNYQNYQINRSPSLMQTNIIVSNSSADVNTNK